MTWQQIVTLVLGTGAVSSILTAAITSWSNNRHNWKVLKFNQDEARAIRHEDMTERERIRYSERDEARNTWLREHRASAFSVLLEHMSQVSNVPPSEYKTEECSMAAARAALFISERVMRDRILEYPRLMRRLKQFPGPYEDEDEEDMPERFGPFLDELKAETSVISEYLSFLAIGPVIVTTSPSVATSTSTVTATGIVS